MLLNGQHHYSAWTGHKGILQHEPSTQIVMEHSGHEQFLFYFILFSDFIGILFSFSFLLDNEEARDTAVT